MQEKLILSPREGYNLIAPFYDSWKWQEFWRRNERPFIERWCSHLIPGHGADLGVGSGNNLKCFLDYGHCVTAYDISEMMLMVCQQKSAHDIFLGKLKFIVQDINELNALNKQYDWIICNRALSHIRDVANVVRKIARMLKNGGECFISDVHPTHHYDHTHFRIGSRDIIIETYKHNLDEMKKLFYCNNFNIVDFREIRKSDLFDKQSADYLHAIQDDDTPIFYYYILKRNTG